MYSHTCIYPASNCNVPSCCYRSEDVHVHLYGNVRVHLKQTTNFTDSLLTLIPLSLLALFFILDTYFIYFELYFRG